MHTKGLVCIIHFGALLPEDRVKAQMAATPVMLETFDIFRPHRRDEGIYIGSRPGPYGGTGEPNPSTWKGRVEVDYCRCSHGRVGEEKGIPIGPHSNP